MFWWTIVTYPKPYQVYTNVLVNYIQNLTKFTPMFWCVSKEDGGEVVEADQNSLNPRQQEDLVLPSAEHDEEDEDDDYDDGGDEDDDEDNEYDNEDDDEDNDYDNEDEDDGHLPLSPTKERMSSNVLALVAILKISNPIN